jgi:4a-hydroxytetrahydrobiopterin dehydratase
MTAPTPLDPAAVATRLAALPDWSLDATGAAPAIVREARFAGWLETIAFVDALAWVCHREDHHPELAIGFDRASVRFSSHDAGGVTERDLRMARRVDGLLARGG